MGMAKVSRRIPVGDIELACRITGCGKPVMLVHGLACGQRMWFHQRRKLSDRRPRAASRPLGFKQIAAALKATVIIQHDMRDIGELPAFPGAAM
jgi:pimeloyl-ACP methyl ester carboxylesterase